jgi:hypothetical protein
MRRCDRAWKALGAALALLSACGGGPPSEPDGGVTTAVEEFACQIGLADSAGEFVPLSERDDAELVLGFQGFLLVEVRILAGSGAPERPSARFTIEVDGMAPIGAAQGEVAFEARGEGALSEPILVFLNDMTVGTVVGHEAEIVVKLEGEGRRCVATGTVTLVDEDPCIMTSDAPLCPDAGTDAG